MMHKAWIESVYDGDTFTAVVEYREQALVDPAWESPRPNLWFEKEFGLLCSGVRERIRIRLLGVDAPEMRGKEKEQGKVSAEWVRNELAGCNHVTINMQKQDSFGRWLCDVLYMDRRGMKVYLADVMLVAGMAEVYAKSRGVDNEPIQVVAW